MSSEGVFQVKLIPQFKLSIMRIVEKVIFRLPHRLRNIPILLCSCCCNVYQIHAYNRDDEC